MVEGIFVRGRSYCIAESSTKNYQAMAFDFPGKPATIKLSSAPTCSVFIKRGYDGYSQ